MGILLPQKQDVSPLEKEEPIYFPDFTELTSFCPHCKSLDTLIFCNGKLVSHRKYQQHKKSVYHDCGSDNPCYLMA